MKKHIAFVGVFTLIIVSAIVFENKLNFFSNKIKKQLTMKEQKAEQKKMDEVKTFQTRLQAKAKKALTYAKEQGFDLNHTFLIDFSLHSGKNRFFVWDFKTNSVSHSSLCAHGVGKDDKKSTYTVIEYSNEVGSLCSSLGKYKTGIRSYSNWGINVHYKLHGLESTNDNAFERIVVLHSYSPVFEKEIHPRHLPLGYSQGCPVIADNTMTAIDNLMKTKDKPVLLWIYN